MMKPFLSLSFVLFVTILLCPACRSARSMAKVVADSLSTVSCRNSVSAESSFASFFNELSIYADSIVLWFQDSETILTLPSGQDSISVSNDSIGNIPNVYCNMQRTYSNRRAQPSQRERTPSKVLIAGVQLNSHSAEQMHSVALARDSISVRESHVSLQSVSKEAKPPNWSLFFITILSVPLLIIAVLIILRVLNHK